MCVVEGMGNKNKAKEQSLRDLWDNIKQCNIYWISRRKTENEALKYFGKNNV